MESDIIGAEKAGLEGKYLTFALSSERYGLEILNIQEIICVPNITRVPKCPAFIKGVVNLRGRIIPLIDLRVKFGLRPVPYDEKTCVIVANIRQSEQYLLVGIIVDTVLEVINFTAAEIESPPHYGTQVDSRFVIGMAKRGEGDLNILIDIGGVLAGTELASLATLAT